MHDAFLHRRSFCRLALTLAAAPLARVEAADDAGSTFGRWVHAVAAYGPPKYGPGFTHFEYVNPKAPKGGTLRLRNPDRRTSFDKFNPFTTRGNSPAGILIWMVEGLAHLAQDEPSTMYALLAEAIFVEPDLSSVSFRIRPQARFSNGEPVTPADVVHSFATLSGKEAAPGYQTALAGIERAVAVDARTVRFELREKTRDQLFLAGTMPVFSRRWGEGKKLSEVTNERLTMRPSSHFTPLCWRTQERAPYSLSRSNSPALKASRETAWSA
jgi:peptide/nickel transport system substrate-binding protein/microcin C transport system substrate-binding protein